MAFAKVYQLNLLGVDHDFHMDFSSAYGQDLPSITLFEACDLNLQDLCMVEGRDEGAQKEGVQIGVGVGVGMGLRCRSHPKGYAQLEAAVQEQEHVALHLLICNTAKSPQTSNTLEWRAHLSQELKTPFEVVYGEGAELIERILYAWRGALTHWGLEVGDSTSRPMKALRYNAFCEKCSDPLCESRLFGLKHL